MRNYFFLILILILGAFQVNAQTRQVQYGQQSWIDYLNQNRYNNKWGSWIDYIVKLNDGYYKSLLATEATLGATYFINDKIKVVGALTYVDQIHTPGTAYHLGEYRPWEMIQLNTESPHAKFLQWLRLEERFKQTAVNDAPSDNYDFTYRLRYYFLNQIPLTKHPYQKGSFSFVYSDEIYFNFGKGIVYNTFDQNRLSAGFYYYLNKDNIFQFGYTNVYQQLSAKNKFSNLDVIRISIFNNIDFRNKQTKSID
jgi:Protein of unknown function (DUF2490)